MDKATQQLIQSFIYDAYGIEVSQVSRIKKGLMNTNYLVGNAEKKFVFKRYNTYTPSEVQVTIEILERLAAVNFPTPRLVPATNGGLFTLFSGAPCVMYHYIAGESPLTFDDAMIERVGELLGFLHAHLQDVQLAGQKQTWDPNELALIVHSNKEALQQSKLTHARELVGLMQRELPAFQFPAQLPVGITHQDVKPENVIVRNNVVESFIDFDNAYHGVLLHDAMTPVIWTCFSKGAFNYRRFNCYLRGYERSRALTAPEKQHLLTSLQFRVLREAFIGPFALRHYPERSEGRSRYFMKLYDSVSDIASDDFYKKIEAL